MPEPHRCFRVNFAKFLRTPFLQSTSGRLRLQFTIYIFTLLNIFSEAVAQRCSVKKMFLEILQNSKENSCDRVFFLNKVAGLGPATLLKKRLWHRCFPMNFAKFLRTPCFTEHLRWLLLNSPIDIPRYSIDKERPELFSSGHV